MWGNDYFRGGGAGGWGVNYHTVVVGRHSSGSQELARHTVQWEMGAGETHGDDPSDETWLPPKEARHVGQCTARPKEYQKGPDMGSNPVSPATGERNPTPVPSVPPSPSSLLTASPQSQVSELGTDSPQTDIGLAPSMEELWEEELEE
ncbi:hypothetical protein PISMIDRAFT_22812 [Pisolithus microcarpus 441]|uniref:Uncharacterized protein n=1 Tax=Pisolithus microcarpus 441 TaxID=765257 RepID=A0A0C9ZHK5_9AGAM|nr:hypothetical protein BKA83DRAFT_22812 [Pisolithus microcarpus]KIK25459.1 hypothetical protein PISMIDRAFT_22812 [Pisolithus microcarpus 441]